MKRWALIATLGALAGCGAPDPCAGVAGACLAVHVASSTVSEVDQLDVDVTVGTVHGTSTLRRATPTPLPAATAIELGAAVTATVEVRVVIDAWRAGAVVGSGAASTTLGPGEHASVLLQLGAFADGGAPDLAPGDGGCQPGGLYCGGDKLEGDPGTLYRCEAHAAPTVRGVCAFGCLLRPGLDDQCRGGGGICMTPGLYCGGDKLDGDPQTLYTCQANGTGVVSKVCVAGCQVNPGTDDACR